MTANFRTGANFIETTCTEVTPHTYDIGLNDVSQVPGFYGGLIEAGFLRCGARSLAVQVQEQQSSGAIFRVRRAA